jgi:hypothetical protein
MRSSATTQTFAREGLRFVREMQDSFQTAIAVQHLALIAALTGLADSSSRLLGYVDAQYKALGQQRETTEQWGYDKLIAAMRAKLSDAEIEKLVAEGAA